MESKQLPTLEPSDLNLHDELPKLEPSDLNLHEELPKLEPSDLNLDDQLPELEPSDLVGPDPPKSLGLNPSLPLEPFPANPDGEHCRIQTYLGSIAPCQNPGSGSGSGSTRRPYSVADDLALALTPPDQAMKKQRMNPPRSVVDLERVVRIDPNYAILVRDIVHRTRIIYE